MTRTRSRHAVALACVAALSIALAACTATTPQTHSGPMPESSATPSPTPTIDPKVAVAEHRVAQEGLAIALASNVLQTQLILSLLAEGEASGCKALPGGGAFHLLSKHQSGANVTLTVGIYYDKVCHKPYMKQVAHAMVANTGLHSSATVTYRAPSGSVLGTMKTTAHTVDHSSGLDLEGLGAFTLKDGGHASLGLACQTPNYSAFACQGGVAQDFASIGQSIGSITPVHLTAHEDLTKPITFSGSGRASAVGATGALSVVARGLRIALTGASTTKDSVRITGGAGGFALFPATPTGWSVTDKTGDVRFTIKVVSNTTRDLTATVTQLSTSKTLATLALDRSGTGTITYAGQQPIPVTSWILGG